MVLTSKASEKRLDDFDTNVTKTSGLVKKTNYKTKITESSLTESDI